jgi:hypothetical protein
MTDELIEERKLATLAKKLREAAGKTRAEAARDLNVARPSVFQAEELPELGLVKLRRRIIEMYSDYEVIGPVYMLRRKR